MKTVRSLLMSGVVVSVTACATTDLPDKAYRQGWRRAEVIQLVAKDQVLKHADEDCRSTPEVKDSFRQFALVSYHYAGSATMTKHRVVGLPEGLVPNAGDQIFVNMLDCSKGLSSLQDPSP